MLKRPPILVSAAVLAIAALACSQTSPPVPPQDPNAVNTTIAQTVAARQTEAALANPPTATFTASSLPPTLTLEPTLSATPDTPEFTPTLETPLITVSVDTNCRVGPGAEFERVGILLVGETAEIVGREPKGEHWLIRNPDEGDVEYCWVWGEYATITGNLLPLLFASPPPPPVLNVNISYSKLETCNGIWWVDFKLENLSGVSFRSISLVVRDAETNTVATMELNGFTNKDGCGTTRTVEALVAGGTLTVSSSALGYDPSGNNLGAKIKLCTNLDRSGACLERELSFKP
jgi:hypothetical protein